MNADVEEKLRYAEWALDHGTPAGETAQAAWEYLTGLTRPGHGDPDACREAWKIIDRHREYIVWRNLCLSSALPTTRSTPCSKGT